MKTYLRNKMELIEWMISFLLSQRSEFQNSNKMNSEPVKSRR